MVRHIFLRWAFVFLAFHLLSSLAQANDTNVFDLFDSPEAHAERVLNLTVCPSKEQVREAYMRMAKIWHPDKNHDPLQKDVYTQKMADVTVSYRVLKEWLNSNGNPQGDKEKMDEPPGFHESKEGEASNGQEAPDPYLLPPQSYQGALRSVESTLRCEIYKNPESTFALQKYLQGSFEDRLSEFMAIFKWLHKKYGADSFEQKYAHVQQVLSAALNVLPAYRVINELSKQFEPDYRAEFLTTNLAENFPRKDDSTQVELVP